MTTAQSHYDLLGVPRTASLEEIKKRYRELARQHHPDLNRDKPNAARIFAEVTAAYKTLSHPDERAAYDADLLLRERRAAAGAARAAANTFPGTATEGSGTYATQSPRGAARPAPRVADVSRLIAEAQSAFLRMKFVEARTLCEQALRMDRRNAQAYEILGDVYRVQNRTDDAINMYTMALQLNPRNPSVMQRLERLSRGGSPSARPGFSDSRRAAPTPRADSAPERDPSDKRPILRLLGRLIGLWLILLLIFALAWDRGQPLLRSIPNAFAPIGTWSIKLITIMALAGLILGFTLAATAAIRRIEDELILNGARTGGSFLPIGLVLMLVSVVSFYAAAVLYTVLGLLQESFSVSMGRVFAAVITIVLLITAVYDPGRAQVFWFGGNVVFLGLLVGWCLGDFFRSEGF